MNQINQKKTSAIRFALKLTLGGLAIVGGLTAIIVPTQNVDALTVSPISNFKWFYDGPAQKLSISFRAEQSGPFRLYAVFNEDIPLNVASASVAQFLNTPQRKIRFHSGDLQTNATRLRCPAGGDCFTFDTAVLVAGQQYTFPAEFLQKPDGSFFYHRDDGISQPITRRDVIEFFGQDFQSSDFVNLLMLDKDFKVIWTDNSRHRLIPSAFPGYTEETAYVGSQSTAAAGSPISNFRWFYDDVDQKLFTAFHANRSGVFRIFAIFNEDIPANIALRTPSQLFQFAVSPLKVRFNGGSFLQINSVRFPCGGQFDCATFDPPPLIAGQDHLFPQEALIKPNFDSLFKPNKGVSFPINRLDVINFFGQDFQTTDFVNLLILDQDLNFVFADNSRYKIKHWEDTRIFIPDRMTFNAASVPLQIFYGNFPGNFNFVRARVENLQNGAVVNNDFPASSTYDTLTGKLDLNNGHYRLRSSLLNSQTNRQTTSSPPTEFAVNSPGQPTRITNPLISNFRWGYTTSSVPELFASWRAERTGNFRLHAIFNEDIPTELSKLSARPGQYVNSTNPQRVRFDNVPFQLNGIRVRNRDGSEGFAPVNSMTAGQDSVFLIEVLRKMGAESFAKPPTLIGTKIPKPMTRQDVINYFGQDFKPTDFVNLLILDDSDNHNLIWADNSHYRFSFDADPPVTTINTEGGRGKNECFVSGVTVSFSAQDNSGGSGVLKTEFSLDNGASFQTFTDPFVVSREGTNTILFRSIDNADNIEQTKSHAIIIDKTPPEMSLFFDTSVKQLRITGTDSASSVTAVRQENTIIIEDACGHTLKAGFERLLAQNHEIRARAQTLQYDSDPTITVPENDLQTQFALVEGDALKEVDQRFKVQDQFDARAKFFTEKNETEIDINQKGNPRVQETVPEAKILQTITKKGAFSFLVSNPEELPGGGVNLLPRQETNAAGTGNNNAAGERGFIMKLFYGVWRFLFASLFESV